MPLPSTLAVLGGALIYVGFVLVINGLWLLGKANSKDVMVINFFTGLVTFAAAFYFLLAQGSALAWAQSLLFSFTYLWIALNILRNVEDQRAFGWYCLLVAITALISGIISIPSAVNMLLAYLTFLWFLWAGLWGSFWVLLVLKRGSIPIAWATIVTGILSYVPAFMYMLS